MSHSKRKIDETEPDEDETRRKRARTDNNQDTPPFGAGRMDTIQNRTSKNSRFPVRIGCRIIPSNTRKLGTVGPIVHAVETDDFYFLTSRHIFGPYQETNMLNGTKVILDTSIDDTLSGANDIVCGEVSAAEYSDELDVALVKIYDAHVPARHQFIRVNEDQMRAAGFRRPESHKFGSQHLPMDDTELMEQDFEEHHLVKLGSASHISLGKLHLSENKQKSDTYRVQIETPDKKFMQILTYKDHSLVEPVGREVFACAEDVGAAVYLADQRNRLRCYGMICQLMNNSNGVLVTPIQKILLSLGRQVGKTLKIAAMTFDDTTDSELIDPDDIELFNHALQEGHEHDRHLRVNIIGFYGQGKTTLTRRLLREPLGNIESTDGIDIHIRKCIITDSSWKICETTHECKEFARRLVVVAQKTKGVDAGDCSAGQTETVDELDLNAPLTTFETPSTSNETPSTSFQTQFTKTQKHTYIQTPVKDKELFKEFLDEKEIRERANISEEEILATIWDFGGQYIYYATHQIFHAREAIYLLVFDLTLDLENIIDDEDFPNRHEKMKNSLKFWVNSINAFVGTEDGTKPTIILVGTHKDKFVGDVNKKFSAVKDLFAGTESGNHIHANTFAVANVNGDDDTIDELRKTIYVIGKEHAARKTVPAKWLPLEMALLCERKKNILNFNDILDMDKENELPIRDENQIKTFLKHHHEKGTLVFFDEEGLNDYVIINPQFLIDAFKCIITSRDICTGSTRLYPLWKRMINKAVIDRELLNAVWNNERKYKKYVDILLMFLQKHRILAEILRMNEKSGDVEGLKEYMIPSLLKTHCPEHITRDFFNNKTYTNAVLALRLENSVVLTTIYEKVTVAALGKWPPIEFNGLNLVFQNVAYFLLDFQHAGMIAVTGEYLELLVINQCSEEVGINVCDRFRRYIELVIAYEFRKLNKDERKYLSGRFFKCKNSDHCGGVSLNVYDVEALFKERKRVVCCPDNCNHSFYAKEATDQWFQMENVHKTQDQLCSSVTEKQLRKIAAALGKNWELLGIDLGFSTVEIDRIELDNKDSTTIMKIFVMLKEWKRANPTNDSLNFLIETIKQSPVAVDWDKIWNMVDDF